MAQSKSLKHEENAVAANEAGTAGVAAGAKAIATLFQRVQQQADDIAELEQKLDLAQRMNTALEEKLKKVQGILA